MAGEDNKIVGGRPVDQTLQFESVGETEVCLDVQETEQSVQGLGGTKYDITKTWQADALWKDFFSHAPRDGFGWLVEKMRWLSDSIETVLNLGIDDLVASRTMLQQFANDVVYMSHDLQSPYLDNGALDLLGFERIQNMFWRSNHLSYARVDINMTLANKIDPSGRLGTAFKNATRRFLQKEFGIRSVSKISGGTAFMILYAQQHQLTDSFSRASFEIKMMMGNDYNIPQAVLDQFNPQFTVMLHTETNKPLGEIEGEALNQEERSLLHAMLFQRIAEGLKLLAAGTALAERSPEDVALASGMMVYNTSMLPRNSDEFGYSTLQDAMSIGLNYVPSSRYISDNEGVTYYDVKPRPGHEFGRFDHQPRSDDPGGYLQQFLFAINQLLIASTPDEMTVALAGFKEAANNMKYALQLGWTAMLNPRNLDFYKWSQEIVLHDGRRFTEYPYLQALSIVESERVNIMTVEVDSFKAFQMSPVSSEGELLDLKKEMDSNFWEIFDSFKEVAKEMNITFDYDFDSSGNVIQLDRRRPLMSSVAGDLIVISIPVTDLNGNSVNLEEFIRRVQARVVEKYGSRKFQDYAKVKVPNGDGTYNVVRLPLWVNPRETDPAKRYQASKTQPVGYEPYMRTVSITVVGKNIRTPRKEDEERTIALVDRMSVELDELKDQTTPEKNALKILPPEEDIILNLDAVPALPVDSGRVESLSPGKRVRTRERTRGGRHSNGPLGVTTTVTSTTVTTSTQATTVPIVINPGITPLKK